MLSDFIIKRGENPQDAHQRLSQEAFFPVRLQDLYFRNNCGETEGGLFPCEPLYKDIALGSCVKLDRHVGILDVERRKVICVVTKEHYELISNKEACDFVQREIIPKVFSSGKTFLCNQVIMPDSRGSCFMDLCCSDYVPPVRFRDVWQPFMRVGNSYNKTIKLSCRLGFCNRDSHDRVIFGEFKVELESVHSRGVKKALAEQLQKQFSNVKGFETAFYNRLIRLSKYYFPMGDMLALYCKVFKPRNRLGEFSSENVRMHNHDVVAAFVDWTKEYFKSKGENAYAAFCVLTAFASDPVSWISQEVDVDRFQSMIGNWSTEFSKEVASVSFNIDDYIEETSRNAAAWMFHDYEQVEKTMGRIPDELFKSDPFLIK